MIDLATALGITSLPLFIAAGLLLNITPGPDLLFVIGRAAAHGVRAGVAAALGHRRRLSGAHRGSGTRRGGAAGCLQPGVRPHQVGRRRLPAVSGPAPAAQRGRCAGRGAAAGALRRVRRSGRASSPTSSTRRWRCSSWRCCRSSLRPMRPARALALAVLGVIFAVNSLFVIVPVAWLAGRASERLLRIGRAQRWLDRALGGLFIALAVRLALQRPQ
jgi:hypothetical protein